MNELERCRKWIEDALQYSGGTHTFEDVQRGIANRKMQLWPAERGCLVTEIIDYPKRRVINIFLGGGEMDQLIDMHRDVIAWAKMVGCDCAMITGRKGWERAYRQFGWKPLHVTLKLEFDEWEEAHGSVG